MSVGRSKKCWSTVVSSIWDSFVGIGGSKVLPDIVVVRDANSPELGEFRRPLQRGISEAVVHNKQLPPLLQSMSGLDERAGSVTRLYNHGGFGESGHCGIALRKEELVSADM